MFPLGTKILIADDSVANRKLAVTICRDLGFYNITEAVDGETAWENLTTSAAPFGLIISDWNMPNVSGIDLLKKVRADKRFATVPFIIVTVEAEKNQIIEAISLGVSGYVIKPFNGETLKARLVDVHKKMLAQFKV